MFLVLLSGQMIHTDRQTNHKPETLYYEYQVYTIATL